MISARILVISMSWAVLSAAPLIYAQDVKPPELTVIAQRRSVIQQLELRPQRLLGLGLAVDPVSAPLIDTPDLSRYREFQFGMNLLAIAKQADRQPSEARVIHQRPAVIQELEWRPPRSVGTSPQADPVKEVLFSSFQVYNDSEKIIARWEDSQYSFNLFRSSYQPTFGMLVFSKRLDALAGAAIVEAIRLDEQEAPQRGD